MPADLDQAVRNALAAMNTASQNVGAATQEWAKAQNAADQAMTRLMKAHADLMRAIVAVRTAQGARVADVDTKTAAAIELVTTKPQA